MLHVIHVTNFGLHMLTSRGSFSAVSTPIFASKCSLESSRRDLYNGLLCTVIQSQNFSQNSSTFFREWMMNFRFFHALHRILHLFCEFLMTFCPDFATNSRKEWCVAFSIKLICENKLENCRNFWNLWKLFNIIQYFSIVPFFSIFFSNRS